MLARDQVFRRPAAAGEEMHVFTYARFHHDCRADTPPRLELRSPPAHGTVAIRDTSSTVTAIREGETDCSGRTYPGIGIWYTPAPGFHGTDGFAWDVVGTRVSHDSAVIEVR